MIRSTFILLKGIGDTTERRLWDDGILDWQTFLDRETIPGIARGRKEAYDLDVTAALHHLRKGQAGYFARCLKPRDHWRLFDAFKDSTVYLDIETTGEPAPEGDVTVVGLYANGTMTSLVRGESLTRERLQQELSRYSLIVTFFGSIFDLPFLRAKFPGLTVDIPHFDLCFAGKRLGLSGGLKRIETEVGIRRERDLHGLDGWEAVRLWNAWQHHREAEALDLLLRYNAADTANLVPLAEHIYDGLAAAYGPAQAPGAGREEPRASS